MLSCDNNVYCCYLESTQQHRYLFTGVTFVSQVKGLLSMRMVHEGERGQPSCRRLGHSSGEISSAAQEHLMNLHESRQEVMGRNEAPYVEQMPIGMKLLRSASRPTIAGAVQRQLTTASAVTERGPGYDRAHCDSSNARSISYNDSL